MKRSLSWCLAGLMLLSLAGCKKAEQAPAAEQAPVAPVAADAKTAENPADVKPADGQGDAAKAEKDVQIPAIPGALAAPADVAAPPADAVKTASGLSYKKLTENKEGRSVAANDLVKLHYTGWTTDGAMFDSSVVRNAPAVFTPENLIPGMKEAITLAKVGEKLRVWIPEDLAYKGAPGAPAGMLVFDFDILDVMTPEMPPKEIPEDAVKLPSGVAYKITKTTPDAAKVNATDLVTLDFSGWLQEDGKRFHSSLEMGEQLAAPVNTMFPAWKEVLPNTHVGDIVQMWVPQEQGIDPTGGELKGTLVFEVVVVNAVAMPQPPSDVASPGTDTQKTASGISWRITKPGTGTAHPTATSKVRVHYSGWTTDGVMFDSSVARGEAIEFGLSDVIPGWTEAVQLMVPGEKRIVWIPEELAYKGRPGAPAGMLVFEIELLDIVD